MAYLTEICGSYRYSISEDLGSFTSLISLAHELGHNLGASHDESSTESACSPGDNYLMAYAPLISTNALNTRRFSNCTIETFKNTLLNNSLT